MNNSKDTLQQIYSILRNHYVVPESTPYMKELKKMIDNYCPVCNHPSLHRMRDETGEYNLCDHCGTESADLATMQRNVANRKKEHSLVDIPSNTE